VAACGFAPLELWMLTVLALAFLIPCVIRAATWRGAFLRGWSFGIGHFIVGLHWIATAFTYQAKMPEWYGWIAVLLLSMYLALFPGLAALLAWRVSRQELVFAFVFAEAWLSGEWLRASLFTGFAWNPLAAVCLPLPWIAQGAKWMGPYGLSGVVVLVSGLLSFALYRRWRATVGVIAMLTCLVWLGQKITPRPLSVSTPMPTLVHVVQPNISQGEKYDSTQDERHSRLYATLSGKPTAAPRLLLWPEAATLHFIEHETDARLQLAALLGPGDILITGAESVAFDLHGTKDFYHNSVFALDSSGKLLWRYDKAHLVPFGEYLPARRILEAIGLSRLVPGDQDFQPGPGPRTFPLPGFGSGEAQKTVGVQICYEITFPGQVIDEAHRPSFIFNPSNDAWFGTWGPPQHLAQARLRAIEEGIPVVRATPTGISAVIDPTGRIISSVPLHHAGVIDTVLPAPLPPTLFARFGLWTTALFGLCLGIIGPALRTKPLG
jgi:apolipoprotein N-acyltransferase